MVFMADIVAIGYRQVQAESVPQSYRRNPDTRAMKIQGFPERLRVACEDAGLAVTQPALSRAFGVSTTTIWHYLNGEKLPSIGRAVDIAGKLGGVCRVAVDRQRAASACRYAGHQRVTRVGKGEFKNLAGIVRGTKKPEKPIDKFFCAVLPLGDCSQWLLMLV